MNEEIKKLLDRLESDKDDVYYVGFTNGVNIDNTLMPKDIKLLVDHITNISQKLKDIKDYVNFLVIFNANINGKFSDTQWGQDILSLIDENDVQ